MSVCNLHVAPDRAWLASDTLQFRTDGRPHAFASKCSLYPHLYALAGFRGLVGLHHRLDVFMNGGGGVLDVEDAAERLPDRLRAWRSELEERHPDAEVKGQIWLAGYAPSSRQFAGWRFGSDAEFEGVELEVPGTWINPPGGVEPPRTLATPDVLVKVVAAQRQMSEANVAAGGSDLGIGGEVLLVELSRAGFLVRKAYRFTDYGIVKARLSDGR